MIGPSSSAHQMQNNTAQFTVGVGSKYRFVRKIGDVYLAVHIRTGVMRISPMKTATRGGERKRAYQSDETFAASALGSPRRRHEPAAGCSREDENQKEQGFFLQMQQLSGTGTSLGDGAKRRKVQEASLFEAIGLEEQEEASVGYHFEELRMMRADRQEDREASDGRYHHQDHREREDERWERVGSYHHQENRQGAEEKEFGGRYHRQEDRNREELNGRYRHQKDRQRGEEREDYAGRYHHRQDRRRERSQSPTDGLFDLEVRSQLSCFLDASNNRLAVLFPDAEEVRRRHDSADSGGLTEPPVKTSRRRPARGGCKAKSFVAFPAAALLLVFCLLSPAAAAGLRDGSDADVERVFRVAGQTALLPCNLSLASDLLPPLHFTWLRNGEPLATHHGRIELLRNGGLFFERVTAFDSGLYICVAKSAFVESSAVPIYLHVKQDVPPSPNITDVNCDSNQFNIRWELNQSRLLRCLAPVQSFTLQFTSDPAGNVSSWHSMTYDVREIAEVCGEKSVSEIGVELHLNSSVYYQFQVVARNKIGESQPSAIEQLRCDLIDYRNVTRETFPAAVKYILIILVIIFTAMAIYAALSLAWEKITEQRSEARRVAASAARRAAALSLRHNGSADASGPAELAALLSASSPSGSHISIVSGSFGGSEDILFDSTSPEFASAANIRMRETLV